MQLREHLFLGTTQSLCPDCLTLIPAKIIARDNRVYFRKNCPQHGFREDFVCSDASWFDRTEFTVPGKLPRYFGTEASRGCPYDCGLCTEHEQHSCIGLLEITSSCNLTCPICFAESAPGGAHLTFDECQAAIDRFVKVEGQPEVLQLSGGEPTVHPQFLEIFGYACCQPIDIVMINTNGIRFARDRRFLDQIAELKHRTEIYLQFDGFDDDVNLSLRGESLLETKLKAIEALGEAGIRTILVTTLQPDVNDDQIGRIVEFGVQRPWITGVSFQPATYSGRYLLPEQLERRITFPDVIHAVAEQTSLDWQQSDFLPLPCAHPNAHTVSYAFRAAGQCVPVKRFIDIENHLDLLANGITFNRTSARELIEEFLTRQCCSGATNTQSRTTNQLLEFLNNADDEGLAQAAREFFSRAMDKQLAPEDVFRITTTSFMDPYNFDVRQLIRSCVHQVLPSGHLIPFSAYNIFYRNGHLPLPELRDTPTTSIPATSHVV